MSFFKSIGKTFNAVVKDIVPITAGVLTGGASLSVLKPTNVLERVDKATGLPVSAIANSLGGTPAQNVNQVSDSVAPQPLPAQNQSVYDAISPYLPNLNKSESSSTQPNAQVLATPVQSGMDTKTMMMIGGGVLALILVLVMGKK